MTTIQTPHLSSIKPLGTETNPSVFTKSGSAEVSSAPPPRFSFSLSSKVLAMGLIGISRSSAISYEQALQNMKPFHDVLKNTQGLKVSQNLIQMVKDACQPLSIFFKNSIPTIDQKDIEEIVRLESRLYSRQDILKQIYPLPKTEK